MADLSHGVIDSRGIETDGMERCDEHASRVSAFQSMLEAAVVGTTMEGRDRDCYRAAAEDILALLTPDWVSRKMMSASACSGLVEDAHLA
ncbi:MULTISPECIES: hypothetical protein [unclassified Rhizobium]|uniref:hypothetical protein n=1 Tax=unclassified Rhizobium TaxID=2613769 RepID=UPI001ADCD41A|nr:MULTISPECIES: hypothetical protein [unclassified Rhizobium]MBO9127020.1 hypothetical protein [Rhizobium sp. 16-488-2b]MBO9177467.1 hypothetical protein [Rhizobium sp. 16-488-2a]